MRHRLLWRLALRNLAQYRLRAALSATAVALGVGMTIATDLIATAARSAIQAADRRNLAAIMGEVIDLGLTSTSLVILAAVGFLVFNAFAMTITQRRRQIGLLRTLGLTRRQTLQQIMLEATLVGGAGALTGLLLGPFLGQGIIAAIEALGQALDAPLAVFGETAASPTSLARAAALGLGIALAATYIPARRATRIPPLAALRESSTKNQHPATTSYQTWAGLGLTLALALLLSIAPPGAWADPPWGTYLTILFTAMWLLGLWLLLSGLVTAVARIARLPLGRLLGAVGRLSADNLQRSPRRVKLTILTLAIGLITIAGASGFMEFTFGVLLDRITENAFAMGGWVYLPVDFDSAIQAGVTFNLDTTYLPPEMVDEVRQTTAGRAGTLDLHMANIPELSFLPSAFSYALDPDQLEALGDSIFVFTEGDWESAMPIMRAGCGVLVAPAVAQRNHVGLGDSLLVTGVHGPFTCTVAGIGRSSFANVSLVSLVAAEQLDLGNVPGTLVAPYYGVDQPALEADLTAIAAAYPGTTLYPLETTEKAIDIFTTAAKISQALMLLAVCAAALGVVNTTVMSVTERRRELGLLRALGATRRQVQAVVTGEAALMGLLGGLLGLVAGAGITVILVVTYGGRAWGIPDLALWPAAWQSLQPALANGLFGLLAAPLVSALAAWAPAHAALRQPTIRILNME